MDRRAFLAAGALAAAATSARAAEEPADGPPTYDLVPVGLPVVIDDRIRNYVFVRLRLHLAAGEDPMVVREKDPHLRDSLVRMAHRQPFTLPGEANRLSPGPIAGHVMATAVRVCGRGVVTRVEVVSQQPQRQVRSV
jgi:hypothetical protein